MEAIRLRWLGQRMGLEKMVLKKGTLIGTFIADQKHPFFEGDTFHAVLRAVQAQPRKFKVYEKAGTLRISVQDVKNVQVAKAALEGVVGVTESGLNQYRPIPDGTRCSHDCRSFTRRTHEGVSRSCQR